MVAFLDKVFGFVVSAASFDGFMLRFSLSNTFFFFRKQLTQIE